MPKKIDIKRQIFGTLPNVVDQDGVLHWHKNGGHAGAKTLQRVVERALALGYKKTSHALTGTADGSHMGGGEAYTGPEGERLVVSSSYGVTKERNYFSINFYIRG